LIPLSRLQIALLQNSLLAENVDVAADIKVPAWNCLALGFFLTRINLFDEVLGIFDNDFMGLSIEPVNNCYLIFLSVFNPPWFKLNEFNVVYTD
jgi:hypothetical protein